MTAYSTQWLDASRTRRLASKWFKQELISADQLQAIQEAYPVAFYTPNVFVRIGLAVFCWILASSVFGLFGVALMEIVTSETGAGVILLFFSSALFAALEFFIREKYHYQSGIDDALLYMAIAAGITGICLVFSFLDGPLPYFVLALPILVLAAIRYLDKVVAVLCFTCLFGIFFLSLLKIGSAARLILPFAGMLLAGIGYQQLMKTKTQRKLRFWEECLDVVEALCLLAFYLSGNYFVIREVSAACFETNYVPFSWVFYVFTAVVPVLYVYLGLLKKDRLLLRIGLVLIAGAVFTFKYYFSIGHTEVLVTLAGAVMIAFAYVTIQYLKKSNLPFTYAPDVADTEEGLDVEALIVAQTFETATPLPAQENLFDGGQMGGGGSGGSY